MDGWIDECERRFGDMQLGLYHHVSRNSGSLTLLELMKNNMNYKVINLNFQNDNKNVLSCIISITRNKS